MNPLTAPMIAPKMMAIKYTKIQGPLNPVLFVMAIAKKLLQAPIIGNETSGPVLTKASSAQIAPNAG